MAYEPAREMQGFTLTDTDGEPLALSDLEGKPVLLYFGYTFCPDFCPATLTDFQRVKEQLGDDAEDVAFVMVTVDPARDTPERLKEYLEFFDPAFIGLTGSEEEITEVKRDFGIVASAGEATPEQGGFYFVDHSTQTYLLDQENNLVLEYPWGTVPEDITEDVEYVLAS
jgi:protein SCO1/2